MVMATQRPSTWCQRTLSSPTASVMRQGTYMPVIDGFGGHTGFTLGSLKPILSNYPRSHRSA
jgi:hypothetical protein